LVFLARDNENIKECKHPGCEEHVFLDATDDPADLTCSNGHRFCANCNNGPHPRLSCDDRQNELDKEQKEEEDAEAEHDAWRDALGMGWKPCPKRCIYGGGFKAENECDHVTCECGHQFCWACGVERQVALEHDNRWHKPSCPYHTKLSEVSEAPVYRPNCPECKKMPGRTPCCFPVDDGYPESYIRRQTRKPSKNVGQRKRATVQMIFRLPNDDMRTFDFVHKPIGFSWSRDMMPITVTDVVPQSPAHRNGVQRGWILWSLDDQNLLAYAFEEAQQILMRAVDELPAAPA